MSEQRSSPAFAEVELRLLRRRYSAAPRHTSPGALVADRPQRFLARMSALHLCDESAPQREPSGAFKIDGAAPRCRGTPPPAAAPGPVRATLSPRRNGGAHRSRGAQSHGLDRGRRTGGGRGAPDTSPVRGEAQAICNEVRRLDHILSNVLRFARPPAPQPSAPMSSRLCGGSLI